MISPMTIVKGASEIESAHKATIATKNEASTTDAEGSPEVGVLTDIKEIAKTVIAALNIGAVVIMIGTVATLNTVGNRPVRTTLATDFTNLTVLPGRMR